MPVQGSVLLDITDGLERGKNDGGEGQEGWNREGGDLGQAEAEEKDLSREVMPSGADPQAPEQALAARLFDV